MSTGPRAVRIPHPGRVDVVPVEMRCPAPGEALVRVAWAGICGSDRDVLEGRRPAPLVRYPVIPGHEWSGTVQAVGAGVDDALLGRPVVGEGFRSCRVCRACRRGDTTLCEASYEETGFTQPGAWSDHLTLPAHLLHVLPEDADLRAAALLEPAACVAGACQRARVEPGDCVAVVGAGTLGLLATQFLKAAGAGHVVVVDPIRERESLALRCGAASLVQPDAARGLSESFDVVVEAAGAPGTARTATRLVRPGGRVVLMGIPVDPADSIDVQHLVTRQVELHTVFGAPTSAWLHATRTFSAGLLDPAALISHEFPLDDAQSALHRLGDPDSNVVKVLLCP